MTEAEKVFSWLQDGVAMYGSLTVNFRSEQTQAVPGLKTVLQETGTLRMIG